MMSAHNRMRLLLFDYLRDELPGEERSAVEEHLNECPECTDELRDLRSYMEATQNIVKAPSERQSDEYWRGFVAAVERRMLAERAPAPRQRQTILELIETLWIYRHPRLAAATFMLAALAAGLVIWRWPAPDDRRVTPGISPQAGQVVPVSSQRVEEYFRKSKVLLIGLSNMKTDDAAPVDLSTERKVSRELVHEARFLRSQPLDERSARLIDDLQRILIELANMHEQGEVPNVEIIRVGIHRENLLFKIRMAEQLYDSASYVNLQEHDKGQYR